MFDIFLRHIQKSVNIACEMPKSVTKAMPPILAVGLRLTNDLEF